MSRTTSRVFALYNSGLKYLPYRENEIKNYLVSNLIAPSVFDCCWLNSNDRIIKAYFYFLNGKSFETILCCETPS